MYLPMRLPRETGRDYALRTMKENIIRMELTPGSMVSENELAAAMGLSRTPVREALLELSKVKIVEIYPQKGSRISLIDDTLVEEARFMRNVLECAVAELDCAVITPEALLRLQENVKLQQYYLDNYYPEHLMDLDNQFHTILFEIARKEQIHAMMDTISIHFNRMRRLSLEAVKGTKIVQDHADIMDAIASHDPLRAKALMDTHLRRYNIDVITLREKYPSYFCSVQ
ncbi:MAG: GntR family transcriptional regulator [Clostridia bacterium]|nr:GntR family transcriptional regulator [Clostridia bacterium]